MSSSTTTNGSVRKTVCPISREQFQAAAKPLAVSIEGKLVTAPPKDFSTGSFGFYLNEKIALLLGGVHVTCQVGMTVTVVGSKELPQ
jgi:hypothetical protein